VNAVLAAVLDALIPEDELGPGALAAGVLDFVERGLADDGGLVALDELARSAHGRSFPELDARPRDELLAELEAGAHGEELQAFFELVRLQTVYGMFADPSHGGNRGGAGWRLIGFPGPKVVFTERDQALG
jgi:gluconate 2-dehydrogenase gamma chain